jgi:hypothetical protein
MRRNCAVPVSPLTLVILLTLLLGYATVRAAAIGNATRANDNVAFAQTDPGGPAATATRSAEQRELSDLRTQVAHDIDEAACSPAADEAGSPTPTIVSPSMAGQEVEYGDSWTVTVTDIAMMPIFGRTTATGIYAKVSLTAVNKTTSPVRFPYDELVLRDATERSFVPALEVKTQNEANFFALFPPSLPTDGFVVFDIATDAEGPFMLESTVDPSFRVVLEVELRG